MGCHNSRQKSEDEYVWNPTPQESKRITLQSTGTLQILLQQQKLRENFKTFIYLHWIPEVNGSSAYFKTNAKTIAINCLDFYIDVRDYSTIKSSTFQIFRSCYIYEKYIMHGASKQIPVSINVLDECTNALFGNNTEENIDCDIFAGAETDALDFLMSEVYPSFDKSPLSVLPKDSNKELLKIIKGSSTIKRRKASFFKTPERAVLVQIMNKVLNDKEYSSIFKKYLISVGGESILYAHYEAVELSVKLSELSKMDSEKEIKHGRYLHLVNGFYDTYISLGARFKIPITEATYGDLMRRIYSREAVEQEVFLPVELETFDILFRDHLGEFLVTADYRQLVRKGHKTVYQMFKQMNMDENSYSLIAEGGAGGVCDNLTTTSSFDIDNEVFELNGKSRVSASVLRELKSFLRSGYDGIFGSFLAQHDKLSLMHFYQSATRYEESHFNHDVERMSECTMIFERYISRNADDQIAIPASIRLNITKHLFRGEQDIFAAASDWTIKYLCCHYWPLFTEEVHKNANTSNANDQNITMGSAGTIGDDKTIIGGMIAGNSDKEAPYSIITPRSDVSSPTTSSDDLLMFKRRKSIPACRDAIVSEAAQLAAVTEFATLAAKRFPPIASPESVHDVRRFSSPKGLHEGFSSPKNSVVLNLNKVLPLSPQTSTKSLLITEPASPKASGRSKETSVGHLLPMGKCDHHEPSFNSGHRNSVLFNSNISAITSSNFSVALQRLEKKAAPFTALEVLDSSLCCSIFKEFLDKEGLAQTLLFFIEVDEFRRIPHADFQSLRAKKICNKYINDFAVMPIPITNPCRSEIISKMHDLSVLPTLFQQASDEVQRYIEIFQFPRFQHSPEFLRVASILTLERHSNLHSSTGMRRGSNLNMRHAIALSDMSTLKQILHYQLPTRYFKDFCVRTFCSENIFFWLDVENYMNLPGSDYMRRMACKIYKKYIADDAKTQVNISFAVKQDIFNNLMSGHRFLFKNAQHEVYLIMNSDTMPKFLRSPEYELLQDCLEVEKIMSGRQNKTKPRIK